MISNHWILIQKFHLSISCPPIVVSEVKVNGWFDWLLVCLPFVMYSSARFAWFEIYDQKLKSNSDPMVTLYTGLNLIHHPNQWSINITIYLVFISLFIVHRPHSTGFVDTRLRGKIARMSLKPPTNAKTKKPNSEWNVHSKWKVKHNQSINKTLVRMVYCRQAYDVRRTTSLRRGKEYPIQIQCQRFVSHSATLRD